jgi:solute carrier family 38 (sodium-coupled neutral amino acid transporter), member 11
LLSRNFLCRESIVFFKISSNDSQYQSTTMDGVPIYRQPAHRNESSGTMESMPMSSANLSSIGPPARQVSSVAMPKTKSGIFGASSNLVNSIVGAGIVGIPYAIRESGFIMGIFLIFLVAYFTDKSLRMIVELASFHPTIKQFNVRTYEDLMMIPFGKYGAYFITINMFILAYGAMVAYLLIIKDTVPVVLGWQEENEDGFVPRELSMIFFSLIFIVPLTMMRDMASLAYTSLLSVLADVILVFIVVFRSPIPSSMEASGGFGRALGHNWINGKLFIGLGVLSTAMACQHSTFIVANSLDHCTPQRWSMVTSRSIGIATVLCILLGVTGYLGFLGETQGDILNNFPADSMVSNAGRALLAVTMFLTYPMESFV